MNQRFEESPVTERDEERWMAQEAARRGQGGDAADRIVASALSVRSEPELPVDFASVTAAKALAASARPSPVFEQALALAALALLLLSLGWVNWWSPAWLSDARPALLALVPLGWAAWLGLALLLTTVLPSFLPEGKRS